jgi:hypothetical protein
MKRRCLLAHFLTGIVVCGGSLLSVRGSAGASGSGDERSVTFEGLAAAYRAANDPLSGFEEYDAILSKLRSERQLVYFPAAAKVEVLERRARSTNGDSPKV